MGNYKYYNRNPEQLRLKDCVCRAVSTATNLKYDAVDNLLNLTAHMNDCETLCVCCYNFLLEDILEYRRVECDFKYTVNDIAEKYPDDRVIIRIKEHLTTSINGTILDIWDCSDYFVDCYWIVK